MQRQRGSRAAVRGDHLTVGNQPSQSTVPVGLAVQCNGLAEVAAPPVMVEHNLVVGEAPGWDARIHPTGLAPQEPFSGCSTHHRRREVALVPAIRAPNGASQIVMHPPDHLKPPPAITLLS